MKKFLLVDDHVVVRSGIKTILLQSFAPAHILEAADGSSALQKISEHSFDLIMLDIQMPNTDAQALLQTILAKSPTSKVLIFSMSAENVHAKRYLKAGAMGYVSKESSLEEIIKAVTLVLDNRHYLSESLATLLANESFESQPDNPFNKLSAREFEIASYLLKGQTISLIGSNINIRVSTVGTHKSRMFEKLGINNLLELKELARIYNM